MNKLSKLLLSIGPGIFAIGYTIGTGSVTSMIVAGSQFGMELLWVLILSCFFSWVLMEAYGRYSLATGQTALHSFRNHLPGGKIIALTIIIGVTFGQWNSLIGILGISANAIFETLSIFIPAIKNNEYLSVLLIAITIIITFYYILWKGTYNFFEKILLLFVSLMGMSFLLSLFIVIPDSAEIAKGFIPSIPDVEGGKMLVAAFVGTTMASATFLSRPLFIKGKGWTKANMKEQSSDARWAAILIFVISAAIMSVACSAFHEDGKVVNKVLDMVTALEPIAGRFAIAIFFLGTLAAGLSSIFPILMICPLMIADYQDGELDMSSNRFKVLTGIACIIGLIVPVFGANPIKAQIMTQVFNVFVLPLVIGGMFVLINNKKMMGEHKAGAFINTGMISAFVFACIISYSGVMSIIESI